MKYVPTHGVNNATMGFGGRTYMKYVPTVGVNCRICKFTRSVGVTIFQPNKISKLLRRLEASAPKVGETIFQPSKISKLVRRLEASAPIASAPIASAPKASAPIASAPIASAPKASAPKIRRLKFCQDFSWFFRCPK